MIFAILFASFFMQTLCGNFDPLQIMCEVNGYLVISFYADLFRYYLCIRTTRYQQLLILVQRFQLCPHHVQNVVICQILLIQGIFACFVYCTSVHWYVVIKGTLVELLVLVQVIFLGVSTISNCELVPLTSKIKYQYYETHDVIS